MISQSASPFTEIQSTQSLEKLINQSTEYVISRETSSLFNSKQWILQILNYLKKQANIKLIQKKKPGVTLEVSSFRNEWIFVILCWSLMLESDVSLKIVQIAKNQQLHACHVSMI